MTTTTRLFSSLFALALLGGCTIQTLPPPAAGGEAYVAEEPAAPPAPPAEVIPPAPSNEHVWVAGHYQWEGHAYRWEKGRYERRPRPAATYVPAHWEQRARGRAWVDGHWS